MKAIKKFFKFIFWTVIVLLLLAVAAVIAIPWWIGPTVTGVSNYAVPKIVDANFNLKEFGLNQYTGEFRIAGLTQANPEGFAKENCLELDSFDVKFDPVSCLTKKIHIKSITLDGLRVVADFPDAANFMKLAENAESKFKSDKECKDEQPCDEPEKEEKADSGEPVKVIIDIVEIKNVKVTYGPAPIVIPDFSIKDIGKDTGGATIPEALAAIFQVVNDKLGVAVGAVIDAGKAAADAAIEVGTEAANKAIDAGKEAANAAIEAVGNVDVSGAANAVTEGAGAAVSAVTEGAGAAMDTTKEKAGAALKGVTDTIGGVLGGAGDAGGTAVEKVGDGAGAAVDAVKDVGGAAAGALKGLFK